MQISNEGILVILFVGLVAGWLAGKIVRGTGFGIIGDILVGIAGALLASLLFPKLGIRIGTGLVSEIVYSTIGAVILLLIVRLVRTGGGCSALFRLRHCLHDPAPDRGDPAVAGLFGARDQVDRLALRVASNAKGATSFLPKPGRALISGDMRERYAKPLFGGLQHRRHAVEPQMRRAGLRCGKAGFPEPGRPGPRLRRQVDQHLAATNLRAASIRP